MAISTLGHHIGSPISIYSYNHATPKNLDVKPPLALPSNNERRWNFKFSKQRTFLLDVVNLAGGLWGIKAISNS